METKIYYQVNKYNIGMKYWSPILIGNQVTIDDLEKAKLVYNDRVKRDINTKYKLVKITATSEVVEETV